MTCPQEMNSSHAVGDKTALSLALGSFMLVSFVVGISLNGLLLWVLWAKMERTVNTLWFLHLTLSYLISCCFLPFFGVYSIRSQWDFGWFLCKLGRFSLTVAMFTTVFLLTIISLDRYFLTCHPIWVQHHRTIPRASRLIVGVWLISLVIGTPYLAFSEIQTMVEDRVICVTNYDPSGDWDEYNVRLSFFVVRILLGFLFPFIIIVGCYCWMGWEIKKKKLVRTGKPFRVLVSAVASFFIFRLPYYVYMSSCLLTAPQKLQGLLWIVFIIGICLNICFTPILYLFVGEKFQQIFKTSIIVLLRKGFTEHPILARCDSNPGTGSKQTHNSCSLEPMMSQESDLPSPLPSP